MHPRSIPWITEFKIQNPCIITGIRENVFACLFSVHNVISSSRHGQVCLMSHQRNSEESRTK